MRRSLADRPVVAGKSLLTWGGAEPRGRLIWSVRSDNRAMPREEAREHVQVGSQAVLHSQADGVGGIPAGCKQQGCPGSGRAGPGGFRGRSEGQPVQDLEPDELGQLLPTPGAGGGNTEAAWRRFENARRAHGRGQDRPNGGGHVFGEPGGTAVPPGFLWVPAGAVGAGRGRGVSGEVLEEGLGDRL
ncbi:hypothetical protein FrEUN1fDRAFT_7871 [Parafrankia sp. EUN1f]|nr:hypothetical protein FrEUN1fDRAFT_7871 [Parafrankia sp. EUN1f]